jgi:hypothetical protein
MVVAKKNEIVEVPPLEVEGMEPGERTFLLMTEKEFELQYPIIPNHLNSNASWSMNEQGGCLFETFGEELAFIQVQDPRTVWTVVDSDEGGSCILSGFHFVNRMGYLVSTVPVPEGVDIEVDCPPSEWGEDEDEDEDEDE